MLGKLIFNSNPIKVYVSANVCKKYPRLDWMTSSIRKFHQTGTAYDTNVEQKNPDGKTKKNIILESLYGSVEYPKLNLPQYIWSSIEKWPNKPMATCGVTHRTYNYAFARDASKLFASALISQCDLKKGDVIGFLLPNVPEFVIAINGALEAGIIVTFVNPLYTAEEVKRQFEDAGVVCCLTIPNFSQIINTILPELPNIKSVIMLNPPNANHKTDVKGTVFDFTDIIKTQKTPVELPEVLPHDIAVIPYSSGTTGLPKGVVLTHFNCVVNMMQIDHPDLLLETNPNNLPTALCVLPFFHIFGYNGVLNLLTMKGAHTVTLPKFTPEHYIAALIKYKPEQLYVVPSLLMFLANSDAVKCEYLEPVNDIVTGAAPCTDSQLEKFRRKFPYPNLIIRQGYGMTELSPTVLFGPRFLPKHKTPAAGQLIKGTQARVVDIENGEDQPEMEPGELWIKGPQIMKGYWNNEKATAEIIDADGWLHTGDIVYYDKDGYFYVIDRTKELIKVKGHQVSPTELENIIIQIPTIADVAIVGIPDEINGEIPKAFVVIRKGFDISEEEIVKYVEPKVAPYKRLLGGVQFIDAIPRNLAGKILRNNLKKLI